MSTPAPTDNALSEMTLRPDWLTEEQWPWRIRAIAVDECNIAYTDVGSGPLLLLVHTGMWSFVWRDLIADLSTDFRCVTLDAPGTGLSTGPSKVDFSHAATAVTAIVESLDLKDLTLVLHDLGGPTALQAAADWPERVSRLTAVNTFGWRPRGAAFRTMLALMGSPPMRELDVWTGWLPRLTSTRFGLGRNFDNTTRQTFRRGVDRRGRRSFHRYMSAARHHNFATIDTAVAALADRSLLTVFGEKNDPLGFQQAWAERFARIEQVEIPKGNHFPMCDDPVLVADAIRSWHPQTTRSNPHPGRGRVGVGNVGE